MSLMVLSVISFSAAVHCSYHLSFIFPPAEGYKDENEAGWKNKLFAEMFCT